MSKFLMFVAISLPLIYACSAEASCRVVGYQVTGGEILDIRVESSLSGQTQQLVCANPVQTLSGWVRSFDCGGGKTLDVVLKQGIYLDEVECSLPEEKDND